MGRKFEVTGNAVLYTPDGVKVVDAEVRRKFNADLDTCDFKYKYVRAAFLIGGARDVPTDNLYAKPAYNPQRIQNAVNYGQTKFFRFMTDLMRLAQWNPFDDANVPLGWNLFRNNHLYDFEENDVDYSKRFGELDAQLYKKYGFTQPMIDFVEARYNYDELH